MKMSDLGQSYGGRQEGDGGGGGFWLEAAVSMRLFWLVLIGRFDYDRVNDWLRDGLY